MKSRKPIAPKKHFTGGENKHELFENKIIVEASMRPYCRLIKREVGTGYRRCGDPDSFFRYGFKGETDLAGFTRRQDGVGIATCVEVKTGAGVLSEDQLRYKRIVTSMGALYIEARWDYENEPIETAVARVMAKIDEEANGKT